VGHVEYVCKSRRVVLILLHLSPPFLGDMTKHLVDIIDRLASIQERRGKEISWGLAQVKKVLISHVSVVLMR